MEKLWQIQNATKDWYRDVFINGGLFNVLSLPSALCTKCGPFFSMGQLPLECPAEIRPEIEKLSAQSDALPIPEFRERARAWRAVLRRYGFDAELEPGQSFLPIRWRIPSTPRYDVFWPIIGIAISQRLRELLEDNSASGVSYLPLVLGPVGQAAPTTRNVVPKNLEFDDDYYRSIPQVADPARLGSFYKLQFPPSLPSTEEKITFCDECGSPEDWDPDAPQPERDRQSQHAILLRKYVPDADLFRSHVYRGFLIRDRIKQHIPDNYLRNCTVSPIQIVD